MSVNANPYIVTTGLVFDLDAANPRSYPGSGTIWYDACGSNVRGTLTNNPTYNSANLGGISFDGVDDYVELNSTTLITGTNAFTVDCFYKITVANNGGAILTTYGSGYVTSSYIWISGQFGLYIGGAVYFPGYPLAAGTYHLACTRDTSGNCVLYKNGVSVNTGVLTGSLGTSVNFRMGTDTNSSGGAGNEQLNGIIYSLRVYNVVLSADQVLQNFNALRGRYGI
jgi:hypothetical protein